MSETRMRIVVVAGLIAFYLGGYFGIALTVDPARARSLASAWDAAIPFVPEAVFPYAAVYPLALLPVFAVHDRRAFRRIAVAYGLVLAISFACFVAFPVTSVSLRAAPDAAGSGLAGWGIRAFYALDPPLNLFPSLHLALATLALGATWRFGRLPRALGLALIAVVAAAACCVKQHFLADVLGGLALGGVALLVSHRPGLAS